MRIIQYKYTILLFLLIFGYHLNGIGQLYFNLPNYLNANNEIGIAGNNYNLTQQNNQTYKFEDVDLQDTSFRVSNFRVCDPTTGELLFYTKRIQDAESKNENYDLLMIYNKENEVLLNGRFEYSLYDLGMVDYLCVVPAINEEKKYYLFYTQQNLSDSGLYYAIIDMNMNGGKGGILPNEKQIKIREGYSFATIVPGNKCNYFLVSFNFNMFKMQYEIYEIDAKGVNHTPHQIYPVRKPGINKLAKKITLSADRYFIGISDAQQNVLLNETETELVTELVYTTTILKFNPEIGKIENMFMRSDKIGKGNLAYKSYLFTSNVFSPDSRWFYVAINSAESKLIRLFRYDISDFTEWKIRNSETDLKDSLRLKLPIEFYIHNNQLLTATSNLISTSIITSQPYNQFHSILPKGDTIFKMNINGSMRPVPTELNAYSIFSTPIKYTYTNSDTIQGTALDSIFCADTFSIVLAKDSGTNFNWSNGGSGSHITVNDYGTYWVTYKGECSYRMDSFTLYDKRKDIEVIKFDTIVCEQRFPFEITNPNKAEHYYWNGVEGNNTTRIYAATDSLVTAFKLQNCLITDTIRIQSKGWCPCETYIPNAFTPNNDGLNDYFKPVFLGGCVPLQYDFAIYDRWGGLVYKSNREFDQGWNGEKNGKPLPSGVYFYHIFFNSNSLDQPFSEKGSVHLIR